MKEEGRARLPSGAAHPRAGPGPRRWPRCRVRCRRLRAVTGGSVFPEGSRLGTRGADALTSDIRVRGVPTRGAVFRSFLAGSGS